MICLAFLAFQSGLNLNFDSVACGLLRSHTKDRHGPRQACFLCRVAPDQAVLVVQRRWVHSNSPQINKIMIERSCLLFFRPFIAFESLPMPSAPTALGVLGYTNTKLTHS
jgi:hypothetical protein